jgi:hypothetical protein
VIALTHFRGGPDVLARSREALIALAGRPGFVRGSLGRSTDDAEAWVLLSEWDSVGSYRRALGAYDVKMRATPLLADALDLPSAFEALLEVAPGGALQERASDLDGE